MSKFLHNMSKSKSLVKNSFLYPNYTNPKKKIQNEHISKSIVKFSNYATALNFSL